MSLSFNDTPNPAALAFMEEAFGAAQATDGKSFLYDSADGMREHLKKLANTAEQPVVLEVHGEGEVKTMADGTQYKVTPRGWVKVEVPNV